MNLHNVKFIKSAAAPTGFIDDGLPQIVFSGKSNVGKSSVINCILNRKNFARVGSTPGKTVHVNYFLLDDTAYLVDLPGYGYAKVSKAERKRWSGLMEAFFAGAERITLGIMIVDSRHEPTQGDVTMAQWFKETGRTFAVIANKADKVKKSELESNILRIQRTLTLKENIRILPFSAEKGTNKDVLIDIINSSL